MTSTNELARLDPNPEISMEAVFQRLPDACSHYKCQDHEALVGTLRRRLQDGSYEPEPYMRCYEPKKTGLRRRKVYHQPSGRLRTVFFPKGEGDRRLFRVIEVPSITDRIVSRAVLDACVAKYNDDFSPYSLGFRPGISRPHEKAIKLSAEWLAKGIGTVVSLDISRFFDSIPREDLLRQHVGPLFEGDVIPRAIRPTLEADVIEPDGSRLKRPAERGIPQGLPLSPFLANVYLHQLDQYLTKEGIRFIRYADDVTLFLSRSQRASRVLKNVSGRLKKAGLDLNEEKSRIFRCHKGEAMEILGFSLLQRGDGFEIAISESKMQVIESDLTNAQEEWPHMIPEDKSGVLKSLESRVSHYADVLSDPTVVEGWRALCERWRDEINQLSISR